MSLTSTGIIQSIAKYLSRLSENIKILNKVGDFSINTYAENAIINSLNIVFDARLINMNVSKNNRYPAIDLLDKDKKIGIQVTSNGDRKKIKETISRFYNNEVYKDVNELYLYVLTNKLNRYDDSVILKQIDSVRGSNKAIQFSSENILDRVDIIQRLNRPELLNELNEVNRALKTELDKIEQKDNLSGYYDELRNMFSEVVLNDPNGMTLKDAYVEPQFNIHENSLIKEFKIEKRFEDDFFSGNSDSVHNYINSVFLAEEDGSAMINKSRMLLLLGYPGQGKTSFCKKIIYDYLAAENNLKQDIFYFRLKDIRQAKQLAINPIEILLEEACLQIGQTLNKFEFRKSVLILDGLDELYMKENLKLDDIEKICKEIAIETQKSKKLKVIITSRYAYVDIDRLKYENVICFQLRLFDVNRQMKWLENYQRFHPETQLTVEKIKAHNSIKGNNRRLYLAELLQQPLLLHIVASLEKIDDSSLSSRTILYDQLFTELINRKYSSDGQLEMFQNISITDLRELIQEIAFAIFQTGDGFISRSELLSLPAVMEYLEKFPNKHFKENLKGIMISFYFKEKKIADEEKEETDYVIEFLHKSLQEFMVAEKIVRTVRDEFLNKDSKQKFVIANYKAALGKLSELFSRQSLTIELQGYLEDMFEVVDHKEKESIADRLSLFMDDFFEVDFMLSFDAQIQNAPIEMAMSTFVGTWLIAQNVSDRNYVAGYRNDQKLCNYMMYIGNTNAIPSYDELKYQVFEFVEARNFNRFGSDLIYNLKLIHCEFMEVSFYVSSIIGMDAQNTEFSHCDFNDCAFEDSFFKACEFRACTFSDLEIKNVDFSRSRFMDVKFEMIRLSNMKEKHFHGCHFDLDTLVQFIKAGAPINIERIIPIYKRDTSTPYTKDEIMEIVNKLS